MSTRMHEDLPGSFACYLNPFLRLRFSLTFLVLFIPIDSGVFSALMFFFVQRAVLL